MGVLFKRKLRKSRLICFEFVEFYIYGIFIWRFILSIIRYIDVEFRERFGLEKKIDLRVRVVIGKDCLARIDR